MPRRVTPEPRQCHRPNHPDDPEGRDLEEPLVEREIRRSDSGLEVAVGQRDQPDEDRHDRRVAVEPAGAESSCASEELAGTIEIGPHRQCPREEARLRRPEAGHLRHRLLIHRVDQRQPPLRECSCDGVVAGEHRRLTRGERHGKGHVERKTLVADERRCEPAGAVDVAVTVEQTDPPRQDLGHRHDVVAPGEPIGRGQHVVDVADPVERLGGVPRHRRRQTRTVRADPGGVAIADAVGHAGCGEPVEAVEPHGLQQLVPARRSRVRGDLHQRAVDQAGQHVEPRPRLRGCAHLVDAAHVEAAPEDGELGEHPLLVVVEQIPAPVHHRLEGLLTLTARPPSTREQGEPLVETGLEFGEREVADPRRREFDRQRNAVELRTDPVDQLQAVLADDEVGRRRRGASEEQLARLARVGAHRRDPPHPLAVGAERLATGRQDRERLRPAQQVVGDVGGVVDQVLAVVEHDQRRGTIGVLDDQIGQPAAPLPRATTDQADRHRHLLDDLVRIARGTEIGQPRSPVVAGARVGRHLERDPGLAAAAHAADGHQPMVGQQPIELLDLRSTTDELGQLHRQVVQLGAHRPQRRMLPVVQLPEPDPLAEISELVLTEVDARRRPGGVDTPGRTPRSGRDGRHR